MSLDNSVLLYMCIMWYNYTQYYLSVSDGAHTLYVAFLWSQ